MKQILKLKVVIVIILLTVTLVPAFVLAVESVEYTPTEEIPLVGRPSEITAYLKGVFQFGLAAIAILAVIMLMIGGYQYIFSGGGKGVESAKQRITNALLGLGLALVSWLVVYTINPDLIELKGIREFSIEMDVSDNTYDQDQGPEDASCSVLEARWKSSRAKVGKLAVLEFGMPTQCMEKIDNITLKVEIKRERTVLEITTDPLGGDPVIANISIIKAQLRKENPKTIHWEFDWEVPNTLSEGHILYFNVYSESLVEGETRTSPTTKSSDPKLEIEPPSVSLCKVEFDSVKWLPGATTTMSKIDATLEARTSEDCLERNPDTRQKKFALKVEIINRGNNSDRGRDSKKVFDRVLEIDTVVKVPFVVPNPGLDGNFYITSPEAGHYFAEATAVYANDTSRAFSRPVRSLVGNDLNVK